ncbi:hypothetical protein GGR53DRAFT_529110 [Hypoxylon sp. FL1150]|nr:hypothetical protein GGR53DRAFT_529110 [Hypoxylon sp. FL1150]
MSSSAEMTGNPTSVWPGVAPKAVSWGCPHLEIFPLTRHTTEAVYRKYCKINATSEADFTPAGYDMGLVEGSIDPDSVPSVTVSRRISYYVSKQTEIFLNTEGNCWGKLQKNDRLWMPWATIPGRRASQTCPSWALRLSCSTTARPRSRTRFIWGRRKWTPDWRHITPSGSPKMSGPNPRTRLAADEACSCYVGSQVDIFVVSKSTRFVTPPPVAVFRSPGILDVFVHGSDARLRHLSANQVPLELVTPERKDVFAWRDDGCLLHKSFDSVSGRWTPDQDFEVLVDGTDAKLSGPPKAIGDGPGSIHVFAYRDQKDIIWNRLSVGSAQQASNTSVLANVPILLVRAACGMSWPTNRHDGTEQIEFPMPGPQSGYSHEDLHPGNVMLGDFGTDGDHLLTPVLKIIDFGTSTSVDPGYQDNPDASSPSEDNLFGIGVLMQFLITLNPKDSVAQPSVRFVHLGREILSRANQILPPKPFDPRPYPWLDEWLEALIGLCMSRQPEHIPKLQDLTLFVQQAVRERDHGFYGFIPSERDSVIRETMESIIHNAAINEILPP